MTNNNIKVAFSGTFDPITIGHKDVIERICTIFSSVTIFIPRDNIKKNTMFSLEDRVKMIELLKIKNITIQPFFGLLANNLKDEGIDLIVRSFRNSNDYLYEESMAKINRDICNIETLILPCDGKLSYISSSIVRELLLNNSKEAKRYLTQEVYDYINERL